MKVENTEIQELKDDKSIEKCQKREFLPYDPEKKETGKDVLVIFGILILIFCLIIIISLIIFIYINSKNEKIFYGISIKGINVSDLTKEEAYEKVNDYINEKIPEEIKFKHLDYETSISTSELNINFDINKAVDEAFKLGRTGNILEDNINIFKLRVFNYNIEPNFTIDEEQLTKNLEDISSKLPDKVIDNSYYIDNNKLIITKGNSGQEVVVDEMIANIKNDIYKLSLNSDVLELVTEIKEPEEIDIEKVHNELYKEPKNAYYTQNPFVVYPSENGIDFDISIEEAKNVINEEKDEYVIPLKILIPNVTTNMIGTEAFPDLLSNFSTKYAISNRNRTTNLILAANKINETVIMPGEIFSYNAVVGKRTISAGYKEAAIYVQGKVVDGLGGGICQIATTLYNSAVYANLEIIERRNHQFIPSYVGASRDATVVYGSTDFKFKNNRDYAIKIKCSVYKGIVNFQIYGLRSNNEYDVDITSRITSSTANAINSEAYKILKQNGQVVGTQLLSKDVYKRH